MSSSSPTATLHLCCHCHTFQTNITLPLSSLPLKSALCHCTLCRRATGHLFAAFAVIPLPATQQPDCTGLVCYAQTEGLVRWFCGECGASVWNDDRRNTEWEIALGILTKVTQDGSETRGMQGLLNRVQLYAGEESTGDGGGSIWVNRGELSNMPRKFGDRTGPDATDEMLAALVAKARATDVHQTTTATQSRLGARCACGAVTLSIGRSRADEKYQAGLDACTSCRTVSGCEITAWATVPTAQIRWGDGAGLDLADARFGVYETSARLTRWFCRGCGATVFARTAGRDTLDVGVGILDAMEGARAESWLVWSKYGERMVAYVEDAVDGRFVEELVEGVERDVKGVWTSKGK